MAALLLRSSRSRARKTRGILRSLLWLWLLLAPGASLSWRDSFAQTGGDATNTGETAEDQRNRRDAFLKAREEMRTLPLKNQPRPAARPTPAPQPTVPPTPAAPTPPPPTPAPTPAATPSPVRVPPTPTPEPQPSAPVVIQKSGGQSDEANTDYAPPVRERGFFFGLFGGGTTYRYLTKSVLNEIDRASVRRGRWKYIVVHNSGTRQGNAKVFDYYHLHTRHMPNGLAYHFVIGNGTSTRDGQIEIGNRWRRQINGGHVHSDYLNNIAIGICLVGDYNRDVPTRAQYAALDELITYLRKRVGRVDRRLSIVKAHREINPVPTDCPGNRFSYSWLHRKFD
jgi:hypothetical protein